MSRRTLSIASKLNPDAVRRLARFVGVRCADRAPIRWVTHMVYQFTKKNPYRDWGMYG